MSGDGQGVDPPIFEGAIPVRVKHNDLDERQALLTLRISCEAQRPSSSHKVLRCRLTDEEDPFLLFTLDLNEEEFAPLKHEQRLLIDFTAFPTKLVELLQHCHEAASQHDPRCALALFAATTVAAMPAIATTALTLMRRVDCAGSLPRLCRPRLAECSASSRRTTSGSSTTFHSSCAPAMITR